MEKSLEAGRDPAEGGNMYYTSIEMIAEMYDRYARAYGFDAKDGQAYEIWKNKARERVKEILGFAKFQKTDAEVAVLETEQYDGFERRVMTIKTEPGVTCIFDLFLPEKQNGYAMLNPHGHGGGRERNAPPREDILKALAGEADMPFALKMVKRGYVVACPDSRGSGDRREPNAQKEGKNNTRANSHDELLKLGVCFGIAPIGWMVWDLMRLGDWLLEQDGISHLICAGMSGGGQQSLYLAALDDRIEAVMISGYFYGFKNALLEQPENCACNYAPHLYETVDMGDLGAMIAPRPFYIESGRNDPLNGSKGIENVLEQVEITKKAYTLLNAEEKLVHRIHEGGHVFVASDVPEFFDDLKNKQE